MLCELDRQSDSALDGGARAPRPAIAAMQEEDVAPPREQKPAPKGGWPRAFSNRGGGMWIAAMLAAAGAFFASQALPFGIGSAASPGPGFFPLLLGTFLVLSAGLIGMDCWRAAEGEPVQLGHRDVLITIATLLLMPLTFERLGAYIALALLGIALLVLIGRVALARAIAATMLGLAGCWYFFQVLLGVQLPAGPW
jgi:hypothetical protein